MTLYLPPSAVADQRRRYEAAILRNVTVEDRRARDFTALLQQINPDLFMVKAKDPIEDGTPLVAGFYHVLKRNQDAPMSVFTVHENGVYCEPDSRVFERLAAGDLHNTRVMRELERKDDIVEKAVTKEKAVKKEDRQTELKERVNAAVRAQVSMDRTLPWTQNSQGRRAR